MEILFITTLGGKISFQNLKSQKSYNVFFQNNQNQAIKKFFP